MEVLEIAAGGGQETGGVILKGGGRSQDDPLLIGDDYLKGEDSEVMAAFSGTFAVCVCVQYGQYNYTASLGLLNACAGTMGHCRMLLMILLICHY